MSTQLHRVNKLEYGDVLYLPYGSPLRSFLNHEYVLFEYDNGTLEINVEELKKFLKKKKYSIRMFDIVKKEYEELKPDLIELVKWAEKNKRTYIQYHEF